MGKTKRACVECGLLFYKGYQMGKHRRMCVYAKHNDDAGEDDDAEEEDDDEDFDAENDDDAEEEDDEEDLGTEEVDDAEEENILLDVESSSSDEDVGCNGNAQRRPQPIMTLKEREVIKFLRLVETGEGMSVAQATDILQWARSYNDERARCLPKTLLTCWGIVDKVINVQKEYTRALLV